jgi:hypothetical protein
VYNSYLIFILTSLQQLMEATAEQLKRCTAAAAAKPADDSGARYAAATAAASAAANLRSLTAGGGTVVALLGCLPMLHSTAGKLLAQVYVRLPRFLRQDELFSGQNVIARPGPFQAAAIDLMIAGMRHISVMLQPAVEQGLLPEQQQRRQVELPEGFVRLACGVAAGVPLLSAITVGSSEVLGVSRTIAGLLGMSPHFVAWSDLTLVLATYTIILKQQGSLPAIDGVSAFQTASGSGSNAAAAARASSRGSSSSNRRIGQQQSRRQQQRGKSRLLPQAAWQEILGDWEQNSLPASHKQLLQLLGVSPYAAVWLATIMDECYPPSTYWRWNFHNVTLIETLSEVSVEPAAAQSRGTLGLAAEQSSVPVQEASQLSAAVEQQLQQWESTPLQELLQPLPLYAALHATPAGDELIWFCCEALLSTLTSLHAQRAPVQQQQQGQSADSRPEPVLQPTLQDELLLLTLKLLQRLQQLRETAGSSVPTAAGTQRTFASAADRATGLWDAHVLGVNVVLKLAEAVQNGDPTQAAMQTPQADPSGTPLQQF